MRTDRGRAVAPPAASPCLFGDAVGCIAAFRADLEACKRNKTRVRLETGKLRTRLDRTRHLLGEIDRELESFGRAFCDAV